MKEESKIGLIAKLYLKLNPNDKSLSDKERDELKAQAAAYEVQKKEQEDAELRETKARKAAEFRRARDKYEMVDGSDPRNYVAQPGKKGMRIRALRDIPLHGVKAGDVGGHISRCSNLSQEGDCWIDHSSTAADDSKVSGNAIVFGGSRVFGSAVVCGDARVKNSYIHDNARVEGNAVVVNMPVSGDALVGGDFVVVFRFGCSKIYKTPKVSSGEWTAADVLVLPDSQCFARVPGTDYTKEF